MPFLFSHVEYCDMHYVYGYCDGNSSATVNEYRRRYMRENILDMVQRSPRLSTRRMASRVGLSRMNVWRTLHEENFYPYHDQRVQHLEPGDMLNVWICATG